MIMIRLNVCLSVLYAIGVLATPSASAATPGINADYFSILRSGDTTRLREALDHGALADARDSLGNTPLIHAAAYGDTAAMRLLLERGAEVNAANLAGATALMRSAADLDKVKLLLSRGASVNSRSALGNTALMLASRAASVLMTSSHRRARRS